jgi:hypothetical protein
MKNFDSIYLSEYFDMFCGIKVRVFTDTLSYVAAGRYLKYSEHLSHIRLTLQRRKLTELYTKIQYVESSKLSVLVVKTSEVVVYREITIVFC